jgi:hypothetical protein
VVVEKRYFEAEMFCPNKTSAFTDLELHSDLRIYCII